MKITRLLLVGVAWLLLMPSSVAAQFHQEQTLIAEVTASTDQTSDVLYKPLWASGLIVVIDVTAAAGGLLLDANIEAYSPSLAASGLWAKDCPTGDQSITGVSTTYCVFTPRGIATSGHYAINDKIVGLPSILRVLIEHGDTTDATYTVYGQWMR